MAYDSPRAIAAEFQRIGSRMDTTDMNVQNMGTGIQEMEQRIIVQGQQHVQQLQQTQTTQMDLLKAHNLTTTQAIQLQLKDLEGEVSRMRDRFKNDFMKSITDKKGFDSLPKWQGSKEPEFAVLKYELNLFLDAHNAFHSKLLEWIESRDKASDEDITWQQVEDFFLGPQK